MLCTNATRRRQSAQAGIHAISALPDCDIIRTVGLFLFCFVFFLSWPCESWRQVNRPQETRVQRSPLETEAAHESALQCVCPLAEDIINAEPGGPCEARAAADFVPDVHTPYSMRDRSITRSLRIDFRQNPRSHS